MILGIGIDTVKIERFSSWCKYKPKQLKRVFSPEEIEYCLSIPAKAAERLAVRFAAREALYKALCAAYPTHTIPFLTLCAATTITQHAQHHRTPQCNLAATLFSPHYHIPVQTAPTIHLSMSHTQNTATAIVILESSSSPVSAQITGLEK